MTSECQGPDRCGVQVDITEDQTSPEQLREAFRGIAGDKVGMILVHACIETHETFQPFVTELDLRVASLPANAIEYLREAMPPVQNGSGEPEYDYEAWLDDVFA